MKKKINSSSVKEKEVVVDDIPTHKNKKHEQLNYGYYSIFIGFFFIVRDGW
jgi:hypothetical protein